MSFEDRVKTGSFGEHMLDQFLRQKGWIPYRPEEGVAHPFDRLMASGDKQRICIVEVKTKFKREAYEDTGIDLRHFNNYHHITTTYSLPLFLAFVDAREGKIYGNWWAELLKPRKPDLKALARGCDAYPWEQGGIVYFQREPMRTIYVMTQAERAPLLSMRVSNWKPPLVEAPVATPSRCIHKPEFKKNGRCWICDHV